MTDDSEDGRVSWYDITIAGKQFNIASRRGEGHIRSVERLIQETVAELTGRGQGQNQINLALLTALAGAISLTRLLAPLDSSRRRIVEVAVLLMAVGNAAPHLLDARPLGPRAQAWLTDGLEAGSIRRERSAATVLDEYLPRSASKAAADDTPRERGSIVAQTAGVRIAVEEDRGSRLRMLVSTEGPTDLIFARWQFPGWYAQIDGSEAEIRSDTHGRIQLTVLTGEHQVELGFGAPPSRKIGLVISGVAVAIWVGLLQAAIRRGT